MKKLLILSMFGLFLAAASGCHIAECWRYSCNSGKANSTQAYTTTPCVVVDECDPCGR